MAARRQAALRAGGRPAHQSGGCGGSPGERDGHVVCESGAGGGACGQAGEATGEGRAPPPARAGRGDRPLEARRDGGRDRRPHPGAAEVSRIVGDGDRGDAVIQIDARPSDSIAVALRLKAPIFTSENLLGLTSVETGEGGEAGAGGPGGLAPGQTLDPDALKTYLQNLDPEDFGKFTP